MGPVVALFFENNPDNIFYVGQVVKGHVFVETTDQIKMRGVRLEVTGGTHVRWSEGSGNNRRTYTGRENYMDLKLNIAGYDGSETFIQPGKHTYPFEFLLPVNIPSTYKGACGSVTYMVKGVIDRPLRINDHASVELNIIRLLDLNLEPPHLHKPCSFENPTPVTGCCCGCCVKGVAGIKLTLNRGCYVAGETIVCSGQIHNRTSRKVKYSSISFVQRTQFCATTSSGVICRSRYIPNVLGTHVRPSIKSGETDSFQDIGFLILPVPASRLDGSSIINISYYIEVKATFHECCSYSIAHHGIIIGNIPLRNGHQVSAITSQPVADGFGFPQSRGARNDGFVTAEFNSTPYNNDDGGDNLTKVHK